VPLQKNHLISHPLKFHPRLANRFSKRPDTTMIEKTAPVKDNLRNTHVLKTLGHQSADFLCLIHLVQFPQAAFQFLTQRRSLSDRLLCIVSNGLHVNMQCAPEHRQTWLRFRSEYFCPDSCLSLHPDLFYLLGCQFPTSFKPPDDLEFLLVSVSLSSSMVSFLRISQLSALQFHLCI